MINHLKPLALALMLLTALSGCSVGLFTSATPVSVSVGASSYNRRYVRTSYGYYSQRYNDPFYGSRYGTYDSFYGSPLNSGNVYNFINTGSNCDSRDCPSEVIKPATTREALMPGELNTDLNVDLNLDLP